VDACVRRGQLVRDLAGAVRAVVVGDEDVHLGIVLMQPG